MSNICQGTKPKIHVMGSFPLLQKHKTPERPFCSTASTSSTYLRHYKKRNFIHLAHSLLSYEDVEGMITAQHFQGCKLKLIFDEDETEMSPQGPFRISKSRD